MKMSFILSQQIPTIVKQNIQNQTNVLSGQLQQLGAQMNECCCSIKTQMLQQRLEDTQARLVEKQNEISSLSTFLVRWAGSLLGLEAVVRQLQLQAKTLS